MDNDLLIVASLLIGTLVALRSGSLLIKKKVQADASLDEFKAHMDERIPALMKQYSIPGCNIALVKDNEVVWSMGSSEKLTEEESQKLTFHTARS